MYSFLIITFLKNVCNFCELKYNSTEIIYVYNSDTLRKFQKI